MAERQKNGPTAIPQDESNTALGDEIRELRKARKMTLSDLATASGVSVSHLSAIERAAVNPSITKIKTIAQALGVPAGWFLAERGGAGPFERAHIVKAENRRNLNQVYGFAPEERGYQDWLLSSSIGGLFHLGMSEFLPNTPTDPGDLFVRDGEVHFLIVDGEMTLKLNDETITLRAGDSGSFPGSIPHHFYNETDAPARLIFVNAPVVIPKEDSEKSSSALGGNITRVVRGTRST